MLLLKRTPDIKNKKAKVVTELARGGDLMESLQLHRNGFQDVSSTVGCGESHGSVVKNQEEHAKELILDVARGRMQTKTEVSGIFACFAWRFFRSRQPSHAGFGNAGCILGEHVTRMQDL